MLRLIIVITIIMLIGLAIFATAVALDEWTIKRHARAYARIHTQLAQAPKPQPEPTTDDAWLISHADVLRCLSPCVRDDFQSSTNSTLIEDEPARLVRYERTRPEARPTTLSTYVRRQSL